MLAFAHRGGAYHPEIEGLENTLAAFEHAVALGYTHLETDVHVTRDGALLAFHDDVLDRVTDSTGSILDLTLQEVRGARIAGDHQVPTLAELFDAFPDASFNIDLKSDGAGPALARFLDERGAHERVVVGSFGGRRLRAFRRLTGGKVATSAHPAEVAAYLLSPSLRLARLAIGDDFVAFQVPHRRIVRGRVLPIVTRRFVERAHRAGKQVHVWTIDDPEEMRELLDLGVDGLMTDRTDLLRDVLAARGQWPAGGGA
ncbi:glycerophosphodiester phosphodiesterase [Nocardioides lacus]|uniref:glycerophosphodiester phosphodiesterase n=1 Tax=Nocardioides sp. BP30 TaxID=3036374 RepID=UPI00406C4E08